MMEVRKSARGILINKKKEVLLMKFVQNKIKGDKEWWVFPGGGVKINESFEEACKRELQEELGFHVVGNASLVWKREITLNGKKGKIKSIEYYYLIGEVDTFTFSVEGMTENESKTLKDIKWWSLGEIKNSSDNFTFKDICSLCEDLIYGSRAKYPIEIHENEF